MGKSTINGHFMSFSIAMLNYQRVSVIYRAKSHQNLTRGHADVTQMWRDVLGARRYMEIPRGYVILILRDFLIYAACLDMPWFTRPSCAQWTQWPRSWSSKELNLWIACVRAGATFFDHSQTSTGSAWFRCQMVLNVQTAGIIRNQTFFVHIWNMLWIVYSNSDPTCYERKQKHTISIYFYLILSIFSSKGWRLKTARGVLLIFLVCVKVMTLHELHVTVGWRRHCNRHLNLPHSQVQRHAAHAFHHVSDHVLHTRCRTVSPRPHLTSPCCATFVSFPATPGGRCHNT